MQCPCGGSLIQMQRESSFRCSSCSTLYYVNVCWKCSGEIYEVWPNNGQRCAGCNWFICRTCGACCMNCAASPTFTILSPEDYFLSDDVILDEDEKCDCCGQLAVTEYF